MVAVSQGGLERVQEEADPISNATRPRLLVTGASGFLGRRVLARAARGAEVVAVVGASQALLRADAVHRVDLSRPSDIEALVLRVAPDTVVHTAAVNPGAAEATPERMWSVNVERSAPRSRDP